MKIGILPDGNVHDTIDQTIDLSVIGNDVSLSSIGFDMCMIDTGVCMFVLRRHRRCWSMNAWKVERRHFPMPETSPRHRFVLGQNENIRIVVQYQRHVDEWKKSQYRALEMRNTVEK